MGRGTHPLGRRPDPDRSTRLFAVLCCIMGNLHEAQDRVTNLREVRHYNPRPQNTFERI